MTIGGDFHPRGYRDTLHLRSAFQPGKLNRREVRLFLAGQALSLIYTPPHTTSREKSGLVGSSIVLVDNDGSGPRLQSLLHHMDNDGPPPSSPDELDGMRYGVSELLSDLTTAPTADECLTVAAALLREAGDLLLGANRRWSGSGKWGSSELTGAQLSGAGWRSP